MQSQLFLITRFNVRTAGLASPKRLDEAWLAGRLELFETICLPAVKAQTQLPYRWLIFFDEKTPSAFRARFAELCSSFPVMQPVYCESFSATVAASEVKRLLGPEQRWVVTMRLDSDDAVHRGLVEAVCNAVRPGREEFINPARGLVIHGDRFYRKRDGASPFIALSESADAMNTVWVMPHHLAARHAPVRQLQMMDAWLQVIHGGNLANQVRGVRVRATALDGASMPDALSRRLRHEGRLEYVLDNSVGLVQRYARSVARRARTEWRTWRGKV